MILVTSHGIGYHFLTVIQFTIVISLFSDPVVSDKLCASETSSSLSSQRQSQVKATQEAENYWMEIRSAPVNSNSIFDESFEPSLIKYWIDTHLTANRAFRRMTEGTHLREKLKYYVEQFGKHGSQADMRWLLADPSATLTDGQGIHAGLYSKSTARSRKAREIQLLIAEFQVRKMLSDRATFERYYQAVVWYGFLFHNDYFGHTLSVMRQEFSEKRNADHWWYARNFMMMAHATWRDDLLRVVKPEELNTAFMKWIQ